MHSLPRSNTLEVRRETETFITTPKIGKKMETENKNIGADFDDFLQEEGILEEVTEAAEAKVEQAFVELLDTHLTNETIKPLDSKLLERIKDLETKATINKTMRN